MIEFLWLVVLLTHAGPAAGQFQTEAECRQAIVEILKERPDIFAVSPCVKITFARVRGPEHPAEAPPKP